MKAIVTGGAGFIGSHIVELLLQKGLRVVVIDNLSTGRKENLSSFADHIEFVESDLGDAQGEWTKVIEAGDWVFHLAALADIVPSIQKPRDYFRANVDGTFNLLEVCREKQISRFIYSASSSGYGLTKEFPTSETAEISPEYPYAVSKRLGEELVLHWSKVYDLPAISLRLFNVYGPRSRTSGTYGAMFGVFLAQKRAGKPFTVVGDGTQTRDFIYVKDVAQAFLKVAESARAGEVYNVGGGNPISVNRICELLEGPRVFIPKRPGEPDCTHADIRKIEKELGWKPSTSIEEGVRFLLQEIDYWKNAPVWSPASIAEETKDWFRFVGKN